MLRQKPELHLHKYKFAHQHGVNPRKPNWPASCSALDFTFKEELQREATSVVEHARRQLERHGLSATLMITEGDPALEILSEAERGEYDLIVIGATGEDDLKHDLFGLSRCNARIVVGPFITGIIRSVTTN